MSKHTKGTWKLSSTGPVMRNDYSQPFAIYEDGTANLIGGVFGDVRGGEAVAESNCKRIVSCVNALAGIPDPAKFVEDVRDAAEHTIRVLNQSWGSKDVYTDDPRISLRALLSTLPPKGTM